MENSIFSKIFSTKMLICIFTGFASGLPLALLTQLLPAWLKSNGVDREAISAFALTQLPYVLKFAWAPFMDNISLFKLGRRRGWMFVSQVILIVSIAIMGLLSPSLDIKLIVGICFVVALFSATQDIAIDAFRRELLTDNEQGLGNTIHINSYRVAGLVPGSLSLILSEYLPWDSVFMITAAFMLPAIFMTLLVKEPINQTPKIGHYRDIIIKPFDEFITRNGVKTALLILSFIFLYKLGDSMATSLTTVFYLDMGFSRLDIGLISKNASLWPSIFGAFLGGILMIKIGINRALWLFGFVQIMAILGFALLAMKGPFAEITFYPKVLLSLVVAFEYFGIGLGTAAFVAFIAKTTNPLYTATQCALFTSIASIPRTLINSTTGVMSNFLGWPNFFLVCAIFAIPGMVLLLFVAPWNSKSLEHCG
jgi:MFS transporter, PAT family, beta-lactamase induction signal transducer AmpG